MTTKAVIYYFSGTGNARMLAGEASKTFKEKGYEVFLSAIDRDSEKIHAEHKNCAVIGIVSAVYGFGLPQMTAIFLRNLPVSKGQKAFVYVSTGNSEILKLIGREYSIPPTPGICILQARFWLRVKGYDLASANAFELPTNWIMAFNAPEGLIKEELYKKATLQVKESTSLVINGSRSIIKLNIFSVILLGIIYYGFLLLGRRFLGKIFVTTNKCTSCKLCANSCPCGTIKWYSGRPYWGINCQQCYRCINTCPKEAIETSGFSLVVLTGAFFIGHFLINAVPGTLFVFGAVWTVSFCYWWPVTRHLMPKWYTSAGRKRYFYPKD